ncbi:MAG: formylmethanofuran dehydrogenase subunit E family protein [Deltaproteobacteria bacterium]|nr:formylmethanofuran dehydrogenase subunit E family protein [Deltaproteobacteria bacterium]MBW2152402.1 formylmethanofuran dehydrogenase subunit E family protein [Deltaproteobacteria bacterium]
MIDTVICGIRFSDLIIQMEEFHGYRSPGILVGGLMLDVAQEEMKPTPYLNAVTETVVCLPDAVQLLTPCTIGNGFLQIMDWGKFALTLYDRTTLSGVRTWLNADVLARFSLIRQWFERKTPAEAKPPFEKLAAEILEARGDLIRHRPVRLHRALKDSQHVTTIRCPECGEFYPKRLGPVCPACKGDAYFTYYPV